jgi:hypothetical protein
MNNQLLLVSVCPSEPQLMSELSHYESNVRPLVGEMIRKAKEITANKTLHREKLINISLAGEKKYLKSEGVKIYTGTLSNGGYNIKYANDCGSPKKSLYYNFNGIYDIQL